LKPKTPSPKPSARPSQPKSDKLGEAKIVSTQLVGHPFYDKWKLVMLETAYCGNVTEAERTGAFKLLSAIERFAELPDDDDEQDPDLYPPEH